jgi:hypothetical protein
LSSGIQRDVNAHPLGVAHPAGGLLRLRQLAVHRLLSGSHPVAWCVRRKIDPAAQKTCSIGIHAGVAQALSRKVATMSVCCC